jgi:uncharacterized membrane protein
MRLVSDLKGAGYVTSTISVLLLGVVSGKNAVHDPWLMICLLLGMLTSVAGMMLRWRSHRLQQKQAEALEERCEASLAHPRGCAAPTRLR